MSRIIMLSGITKGEATSCCFVGSPQLVGKTLCNVARGLVGSCAITIKRLRELAGRSRTMAVRLRLYVGSGLSATRKNILAPGSVGVYSGGSNYNPAQVIRDETIKTATEKINKK